MIPLTQLAAAFLKIGALGFGGPFSLLAIMEKEVVQRRNWMTAEDFTRSVGIGTLTPGPIFFAAAIYVGYRLRAIPGAVVSAAATLLPSFILVLLIASIYVEVESTPILTAVVQGIATGVVGLFLSVVIKTARATICSRSDFLVAAAAFAALALFHVDPIVLILAAGLAGAWLARARRSRQTS